QCEVSSPGCSSGWTESSHVLHPLSRGRRSMRSGWSSTSPAIRDGRNNSGRPSMSLRILAPGAARDRYLPLLYLADDSAAQVHSYYQLGDLYVLDVAAGDPCAIVLAIGQDDAVVELKSVAVATPLQGQGIGRQLLSAVLDELRQRGIRRVIVGTSSASI